MSAPDYLRLSGTELPEPGKAAAHKAIVVIEEGLDPAAQSALAAWLVDQHCLYAMVWARGSLGSQCPAVVDAIWIASRQAFPTTAVPDDRVVIATSHEGESLKDVFWFAKNTASHPCDPLDHTVILHIGSTGREQELLESFAAA